MIGKEHLRQVSVEKVTRITDEIFVEVIDTINQAGNYLNDTEKIVCITLLGEILTDACEDVIGGESLQLIKDLFASKRENSNGTKENNKEEREHRTVQQSENL